MAMCRKGTMHQNTVMSELLTLVLLKLARFLPKDKSENTFINM